MIDTALLQWTHAAISISKERNAWHKCVKHLGNDAVLLEPDLRDLVRAYDRHDISRRMHRIADTRST